MTKPRSHDLDLSSFRELPAAAGLPLDEISQTLANRLAAGDDPYQTAGASADPGATSTGSDLSPRSILEAVLFVGPGPGEFLTSQRIADMMRGVRSAEIDTLVAELNRQYRLRNCPYEIVLDNGGYRLTLRGQYHRLREKLQARTHRSRLSRAAVEVLALVAYRQPLTADDITRLRGRSSGQILTQLVRRQLLRVEREPGRKRRLLYFTTERFLGLFGLRSLSELPPDGRGLEPM